LPFRHLRRLSLDQYIKAETDPEALWLFLHVPKTAGSSFSSELSALRPPYRNIHIDYHNRSEPFADQLQRAVDTFIADAKHVRFRSASGHLELQHARQISDAIPGCKLVTLVRDPVARIVSDYRYQRTGAHPPYREFIAKHPTLMSYVASRGAQDKMFGYLSGDKTLSFEKGYRSILETFAFIGLVEHYPMCFNVFSRLLALDEMPRQYRRRTDANADNRVELDRETIREIRRLNPHDCRLFNRIEKLWNAVAEEWRDTCPNLCADQEMSA
jgi:hypothetical protein